VARHGSGKRSARPRPGRGWPQRKGARRLAPFAGPSLLRYPPSSVRGARVPDAVLVGVPLTGIEIVRTVVTGVADRVAVAVELQRVEVLRADVAVGAQAVAVLVVRFVERTGIAGVAEQVVQQTAPVLVELVGVGDVEAVVTRISHAVSVEVLLERVRRGGAVVRFVGVAAALRKLAGV
jgi:hypothetical protein